MADAARSQTPEPHTGERGLISTPTASQVPNFSICMGCVRWAHAALQIGAPADYTCPAEPAQLDAASDAASTIPTEPVHDCGGDWLRSPATPAAYQRRCATPQPDFPGPSCSPTRERVAQNWSFDHCMLRHRPRDCGVADSRGVLAEHCSPRTCGEEHGLSESEARGSPATTPSCPDEEVARALAARSPFEDPRQGAHPARPADSMSPTAWTWPDVDPSLMISSPSPVRARSGGALSPLCGETSALPCRHNNWDNVRTKKGKFTLRCRECDATHRIRCAALSSIKCRAHWLGVCPNSSSCPALHVHKFKNPERAAWQAHRLATMSVVVRSLKHEVEQGNAQLSDLKAMLPVPDVIFGDFGEVPNPLGGGEQQQPPQAPPTPAVASPAAGSWDGCAEVPPCPCGHNNWDSTKLAHGRNSLRCRDCFAAWKVPNKGISKCKDFFYGCCTAGAACRDVHVHRYKNQRKEAAKALAAMQAAAAAAEKAVAAKQEAVAAACGW
eukprot:TRINITY_DN4485_c1_g2_i1.p1 TRINITY_DN4485_c1_g2~~TRINITY_DN4485_c1_g2_i1.p1  ORF type:complete len:526 (+),score=152.00 TRINITY_DN4485_c1_g2_i1:86-1579(+)